MRPATFPEDVESKELDWWRVHADVENKYCWVQPETIRRVLRSKYVSEIARMADGKRVLELGCGTGWLCFELACAGAHVVGTDFSEDQLVLARKEFLERKIKGHLEFRSSAAVIEDKFDIVIVHGFLHHLSVQQIKQALSETKAYLKPSGLLLVMEPKIFQKYAPRNGKIGILSKVALKGLSALRRGATVGRKLGLRRFSQTEARAREILSTRNWGTFPCGPSPKEMPFCEGELEGFLREEGFSVEEHGPVLFQSHLVMQEWLLRSESHPVFSRMVNTPIAMLAAALDAMVIKGESYFLSPGSWVCCLFVARPDSNEFRETSRLLH